MHMCVYVVGETIKLRTVERRRKQVREYWWRHAPICISCAITEKHIALFNATLCGVCWLQVFPMLCVIFYEVYLLQSTVCTDFCASRGAVHSGEKLISMCTVERSYQCAQKHNFRTSALSDTFTPSLP